MTNENDPDFSMTCSRACTRAGLTILVLSALAIAMLQPLEGARASEALGQYISLRYELRNALARLDLNQCWKVLKKSAAGNDAVNKWNLSKLTKYQCNPEEALEKPPQSDTPTLPKKKDTPLPTSKEPLRPNPPGFFHVEISLSEVDESIQILTKLLNANLLDDASSSSHAFKISISNWKDLLYRSLTENESKETIIISIPQSEMTEETSNMQQDKREQESIVPKTDLLNFLTLKSIKDLSEYEFPKSSEIESLLKELDRLSIPSIAIPVRTIAATNFVELFLLIAIVYFWLFFREARSSPYFPFPGTLFGVFSKTFISRVVFFILVSLPVIASTLLAIKSFKYTYMNSIAALFIFLIAVQILRYSRLRESQLVRNGKQ
jgi:hypothetical protein